MHVHICRACVMVFSENTFMCIHLCSQQGTLLFLDTLVTIGPNYNSHTTVYRKPTHTDQYLHWGSNHSITAKQSVYNTLAHRANIVSSNQEALHKELDNIKKAFQACQLSPWALNQLHQKFIRTHNNNQDSYPNRNSSNRQQQQQQ